MSKRRAVSFVRVAAVLTIVLGAGWAAASAVEPPSEQRPASARDLVSRDEARQMREKAFAIEERGAVLERARKGGPSPAPATTIVTEREVNSYLAFDAGSQIPVGIVSPRIRILGDGRLLGSALVDLDAVRTARKASGWLDPMSYLTGQMPVSLSGRLRTGAGLAYFDLESASISGIPIPRTLVQELLTHYSRTSANPRGLNLDDPFQLPARITRIDVRPSEAVVVQQ